MKVGDVIVSMRLDEYESNDYNADEILYDPFEMIVICNGVQYVARVKDRGMLFTKSFTFVDRL